MPPVYPPFFSLVREEGRRVVESPLRCTEDGRWEIDFEDLENKARDAKILLLCSPHNPVGRVWTREELESLVQIASRYELTLVSDEDPRGDRLPGKPAYSPCQPERGSPAKNHKLHCRFQDLQCGGARYLRYHYRGSGSSGELLQSPSDLLRGIPIFSACALLRAAFTDCDEWLAELVEYLDANRRLTADFLAAGCPGYPGQPSGGRLPFLAGLP